MPTILTCPSCGKLSQVVSRPPGSAVRCPHCAAVMKVPPESPGKVVAPAHVVAPPMIIAPPPTERPVPGVPPLLPPLHATIASSSAGYVCVVCGKSFPLEAVYDLDGSIICETCHASRAMVDLAAAAAPDSFPLVPSLSTSMPEEDATNEVSPDEFPPNQIAPDEFQPDEFAPASNDEVLAAPGEDFAEAEVPAESVTSVPAGDFEQDAIAGFDDVTKSPSQSRREPRKKPFPIFLVASGCGFFVVLLAGLLLYMTRSGDSSYSQTAGNSADWPNADQGSADDPSMSEWEQKYAPRLSKWRSTAKSLELSTDSGDLGRAQMLYQQMLDLAKSPGATITSAGVRAELAEARAGYDRITKIIGPPPTFITQAPLASDAQTDSQTNSQTPAITPAAAPATPPATGPSTTGRATAGPAASAPPVPVADWATSHHNAILNLSHQADALEHEGQPAAAFLTSVSLLQLVADHRPELTDPQIKAAIDAAEAAEKRLILSAKDSDAVRLISAHSLLAAGLRAEQDKKWQSAAENLADASHLLAPFLRPVQRYRDPTYLAALDATAIAYRNLKQQIRADQLFADGEPLGIGSKVANSPSRELIWNRAVNDLGEKTNIQRSIKMVRDYMDPQTDPDEPMLNLLGTMLFVGDEMNPPNRKIIDDTIGFYGQRSMDLEKAHPGQQRWGIQWLPEADAKIKFDEYNKAIDAYQTVVRTKTAAENKVQDIQDAMHRPGGPHPAASELAAAKAQVAAAATAIKAAHDAIPRPPWLTDVQPIVPTIDADAPVQIPLDSPAAAPAITAPPATAPAGIFPDANLPARAVSASPVPASQPTIAIVPPAIPAARYAAAFPIDRTHLITAALPLGNAGAVTIQNTQGASISAKVIAKSDRLALLEVAPADAGGGLKYFSLTTDFIGGSVYCPAIPQANIFIPVVTMLPADSAPVPTRSQWWVGLSDNPRLAGSPLLDAQNQVIGVEVATRDDPKQKIPAVTLDDLRKFLDANHIIPGAAADKPDASIVWQVSAIADQ